MQILYGSLLFIYIICEWYVILYKNTLLADSQNLLCGGWGIPRMVWGRHIEAGGRKRKKNIFSIEEQTSTGIALRCLQNFVGSWWNPFIKIHPALKGASFPFLFQIPAETRQRTRLKVLCPKYFPVVQCPMLSTICISIVLWKPHKQNSLAAILRFQLHSHQFASFFFFVHKPHALCFKILWSVSETLPWKGLPLFLATNFVSIR